MVSFAKTIKILLSLTYGAARYWGYTATALHALLKRTCMLPYQNHLWMANLNPLGHLLSWDDVVISIFMYSNIRSP